MSRKSMKRTVSDSTKSSVSSTVKKSKVFAGTVRTDILKGGVPVDRYCTEKLGIAHVLLENSCVYDVTLNQTNIAQNNNKFYIIQLLEDDSGGRFSVWNRWGRVGVPGQNKLFNCGPNLDEAKRLFTKKFYDKTKNDWSDRDNFEKVPGKYDMVRINYACKETDKLVSDDNKPTTSSSSEVQAIKSELPESVQGLMKLIFDLKSMTSSVVEMKYDAERAPLGRLTGEQIDAGYRALRRIEQLIMAPSGVGSAGRLLSEATGLYYTRIPHTFGMKVPPTINTLDQVRAECDLLQALSDVQVAVKIMHNSAPNVAKLNPLDCRYESLQCRLTPLEPASPDYEVISAYLGQTHAPTHSHYKMRLTNVFQCEKPPANDENFRDVGSGLLLWHGSRLLNWAGILSKGLCIAPPEAPITGHMFGKGVYFADMSSKSANYCYPTRSNPVGLLLLCQVSLGKALELNDADYEAAEKICSQKSTTCSSRRQRLKRLGKGKSKVKIDDDSDALKINNSDSLSAYHSVLGLGRMGPDRSQDRTLSDGLVVPCGRPINYPDRQQKTCTLNYNEYVVYDTRQIRLRYLCELHFDFVH